MSDAISCDPLESADEMEKCRVGLKNLQMSFRIEELFLAQNISRY